MDPPLSLENAVERCWRTLPLLCISDLSDVSVIQFAVWVMMGFWTYGGAVYFGILFEALTSVKMKVLLSCCLVKN